MRSERNKLAISVGMIIVGLIPTVGVFVALGSGEWEYGAAASALTFIWVMKGSVP